MIPSLIFQRFRLQRSARPVAGLALLIAEFTLAMFTLAPLLLAQHPEEQPEEQSRLRSLRSHSVAVRREALGWLAKNGEYGGAAVIVKSLKDDDLEVRKLAERTLWAVWSRSGNSRVDEMLRMGGLLMSQGSLWQAVHLFDEVISEMPEFAEGYNKRATAWYLLGSYRKSLADIERTLNRNPAHFGALSGAGYCMIRLKRYGEAVKFLRRALKINPNLEGVRELTGQLMKQLRRNTI